MLFRSQARLHLLAMWQATREQYEAMITMARGRKGFGGGLGGESHKIKALLVVIVLVLVIPAIALVFSGPTTSGGSGVYGNSTVSAAVRTGTVSFSQFIGIIMIIGAVIVLVSLLG